MLGMKGWSSALPCLCCRTSKGDLHKYSSCTCSDSPWPEYTHEQWIADIKKSIVKVVLTSRDGLLKLLGNLKFIKKKKVSGRLVVEQDLDLGLDKHMRLLPIGDLVTVHDLSTETPLPITLFFFSKLADVHINDVCQLVHIEGVNEGCVSNDSLVNASIPRAGVQSIDCLASRGSR